MTARIAEEQQGRREQDDDRDVHPLTTEHASKDAGQPADLEVHEVADHERIARNGGQRGEVEHRRECQLAAAVILHRSPAKGGAHQ